MVQQTFNRADFEDNSIIVSPDFSHGGRGYHFLSTSLNKGLERGEIWNSITFNDDGSVRDIHKLGSINFTQDDEVNRTISALEDRVDKRIQDSPGMQALLEKPEWTAQDRQNWEEGLSGIVSEEVDRIPVMRDYRTASRDDVVRTENQADASVEIAQNTRKLEVDCEHFAVTEGGTMQVMENKYLGANGAFSADNLKGAGDYRYTVGMVTWHAQDQEGGGHAYILTPAGNIVEATTDPSETTDSPYLVVLNKGDTLENYRKGIPLVTEKGSVYGADVDTDHQRLRAQYHDTEVAARESYDPDRYVAPETLEAAYQALEEPQERYDAARKALYDIQERLAELENGQDAINTAYDEHHPMTYRRWSRAGELRDVERQLNSHDQKLGLRNHARGVERSGKSLTNDDNRISRAVREGSDYETLFALRGKLYGIKIAIEDIKEYMAFIEDRIDLIEQEQALKQEGATQYWRGADPRWIELEEQLEEAGLSRREIFDVKHDLQGHDVIRSRSGEAETYDEIPPEHLEVLRASLKAHGIDGDALKDAERVFDPKPGLSMHGVPYQIATPEMREKMRAQELQGDPQSNITQTNSTRHEELTAPNMDAPETSNLSHVFKSEALGEHTVAIANPKAPIEPQEVTPTSPVAGNLQNDIPTLA